MFAPEFTLAAIVQVNKDSFENFHLEFVCRVASANRFFFICLLLKMLYGFLLGTDSNST